MTLNSSLDFSLSRDARFPVGLARTWPTWAGPVLEAGAMADSKLLRSASVWLLRHQGPKELSETSNGDLNMDSISRRETHT